MSPSFHTLIDRYLTDSLSEEEREALFEGISSGKYDLQLDQLLDEAFNGDLYNVKEDDQLKELLFQKINRTVNKASTNYNESGARAQRFWLIRTPWIRYAALFILLLGSGYLYWNSTHRAHSPKLSEVVFSEIAPGGNKATLTLSNGKIIILEKVAQGKLAEEGSTQILKLDEGSLSYQSGIGKDETLYNTIATPRGGQFQIILPDGSKVWLNASSSIKFPTVFSGKERKVAIMGEAYFEIVANSRQPFIVNSSKMDIEVLGTSFNVNTYADEANFSTTLLNGSVKVSATSISGKADGSKSAPNTLILREGQQVLVNKKGEFSYKLNANIDQIMAWKNGAFNFQDKGLEEVMRELSRWYDIDVVYEKGIPNIEFGGEMGRNLNFSQVLKSLGEAGLRFKLENNNQLVILP